MNRLLLIISVVLFTGCNDVVNDGNGYQLPANSKVVDLQLIDSLGKISFSIPLTYDTSFSWIHQSDCGKPCDKQKYRFQSKKNSVIKETGFLWPEVKDSVESFTIIHSMDFPFRDGDTSKRIIRYEKLKEQIKSDPLNAPVILDTIEKINDRYFFIIAMERSGVLQYKKVIAITTIKNNEIQFQYELLTKRNDSLAKKFINNSLNLLKTIRISKGI